jgi:hypothetical protein
MNQWLEFLAGAIARQREKVSFSRYLREGPVAAMPLQRPNCMRLIQTRSESLAKKRRTPQHHRGKSVSSISYLPQTFTTLFFLAASLLLGLIR